MGRYLTPSECKSWNVASVFLHDASAVLHNPRTMMIKRLDIEAASPTVIRVDQSPSLVNPNLVNLIADMSSVCEPGVYALFSEASNLTLACAVIQHDPKEHQKGTYLVEKIYQARRAVLMADSLAKAWPWRTQ
jgi:hypothetical protein